MFSPLGQFKHIVCPFLRTGRKCQSRNCFFSHDFQKSTKISPPYSENVEGYPKVKIEKSLPCKYDNCKLSICVPIVTTCIPYHSVENLNFNIRQNISTTLNLEKTNDSIKETKNENFRMDVLETYKCKQLNHQTTHLPTNTVLKKRSLSNDAISIVPNKKKQLVSAISTNSDSQGASSNIIPTPKYDSNSPAGHELRKRMTHLLYESYKDLGYSNAESSMLALLDEKNICETANSKMIYSSSCKSKILSLKKAPKKNEIQGSTPDEKLESLVHSEEELILWGYNIGDVAPVNPPDELRECDRCGTRFADPRGPCTYHWGKLFREKQGGEKIRTYTCCGVKEGDSSGCIIEDNHVFKYRHLPYLASVHPFSYLPDSTNSKQLSHCALDCELCYTTNGMELARLTVVAKESIIMDVFIKPKGKILSLNTRFSGIHDAKELESGITMDQMYIKIKELGMNKNTILIGHGLENDLNAMRLIHKRVIDTALLFTHARGPPFRYSLKYLTKKYLGTTIQTSTHDSEEDAVSALQLVFYKIKSNESQN